jgi:2-methylisocitrate lyase-like PEP mutase family enzyme
MDRSTLRRKADVLRTLHGNGRLLVLPNVWDPIGARIVEAAGLPAVATASAAISASLGYVDGEAISRGTMLEIVGRIARSVEVPVSADMERGYGESLAELRETIRLLVAAGAVGLNIEDSLGEEESLRGVDEQCQRIATVREAAAAEGVPLVINARADAFLTALPAAAEERLEETVRRAEAYARAGADCIYPIGPGDRATVSLLRARIRHPINILAHARAMSLAEMQEIGIDRVSFGPGLFRSGLQRFADSVARLAALGPYDAVANDLMPRDEVQRYLMGGPETGP